MENGGRCVQLIRSRPLDIACDVDLYVAETAEADLELCRGALSATYTGVHAAEAIVEEILQLSECDACDGNLTDIGNYEHSIATHLEWVRSLDVAREYQS